VPVYVLDLGVNFLLEGHHSKITINYKRRPDVSDINQVQYRNDIIVQAMVYL
jgi:hypothetical protein